MEYPCFFFTLLCFFLASSIHKLAFAADSIAPGQSIHDGETLVSSSQIFELGFFSLGSSKNRFIGIWYKDDSETIVWVANREKPVTDSSGVLAFNYDGNLVLYGQANAVVWSTNITGFVKNPVGQLLDSGNFVLKNNSGGNSENYMWQGFDYPTDTMLPGMILESNSRNGVQRNLTSWRSTDDPSPGEFTYKLDFVGLPQMVILKGSAKYSRTGMWNGVSFGAIPMVHNLVFIPTFVFNDDDASYSYEPTSSSITMRLVLNQTGYLIRYVWCNATSTWGPLYYMPFNTCDRYGQCGANGVCSVSKTPMCQCLQGFVPKSRKEWQASNWTSGCVRSTPLDCRRDEGFVRLQGVKLPDLIEFSLNKTMSLGECAALCTKNCSCTAYANSIVTAGGSGCLMWFGDLVDMRFVAEDYSGQVLYVRSPGWSFDPSLHSSKKKKQEIAIIGNTCIAALLLIILILYYALWRDKGKRKGKKGKNEGIELPLFDFTVIAAATNNFAPENIIGEGGFGPVYKGMLRTGEAIAVKRLSKNSGQGADEFMNEVDLIAKLQHRNLVGLVGCCIQREERMLVYEFMPNKSLNTFIFDSQRSAFLRWPNRFDIIMGIAKGLVYLHQDSKLQIIHRDLKASNILLDRNLKPKISDFGLARIAGGNDREETTKNVVGTQGYMAPEYAIDGTISVKSDVFSFGVLLLEILSGKKNRGFFHEEQKHNLLGHAWFLWTEGRALEIIDPCIKESSVTSQVLRCVQVGLLCVENFPEDRPAMSSVVFMLANEEATLAQPKQPGFFRERSSMGNKYGRSTSDDSFTANTLSITMFDGR